ncbi:hypothetical protein GTY41_03585 [Streptomyces sp. SID685]|uniref:hypothetical protein n=1 Tax=Streptomyces sp. SID685 TaxID=2690322 RepID=UPI001367B246|nr:hypothetical protein [Streptomyces sp. SID685]MYR84047.1 hypothetical protein [Streptomyces sp. SID685]
MTQPTPAASPAVPAPATDPTAEEVAKHVTRAIFALKVPSPDGSQHYQSGRDDGLEAAMDAARDAVLAVLPATDQRAAALTDREKAMLGFALEMAQEEIHARSLEVTDEDRAALEALRRLAGEAQQDEAGDEGCETGDMRTCTGTCPTHGELPEQQRTREAQPGQPQLERKRLLTLATPCAVCQHPYNWHTGDGCQFDDEVTRCGCIAFAEAQRDGAQP